MKIHEVQAPSITGETRSKHQTKRKGEKEKELSQVGVVLKSPGKLSGTFEGSYLIFMFEGAVLAVLVSGEDVLNIADSEREIRHVFLFSGFGHSSRDCVSIANLEPGRKSAVPVGGKFWGVIFPTDVSDRREFRYEKFNQFW